MSSFRRRLMMAQGGGSNIPSDDGVYIQSIDGQFYTLNEWNRLNNQANGVAIINKLHPNRGFVISKDGCIKDKSWGTPGKKINGVIMTNDLNSAKRDYSGFNNTNNIISQEGLVAQAAYYCSNYTFPNGKKGYLGSLGEFVMAYSSYDNKVIINRCMQKIGGNILEIAYYTSTQFSEYNSYALDWYTGAITDYNKGTPGGTIPFTKLL